MPTVVSIQVTSGVKSCDPFFTVSFRATAKMSDGSERDVTPEVAWASSAANVMIVLGKGSVRCLSAGTTTVSATLGTIRGELMFQVMGPKITSYVLSPSGFTRPGASERFQLMASYDDGHDHDLSSLATFESSNTAVMMFFGGSDGQVVGVGTTQVTAKLGNISVASVMLVASDIKLDSIAITPPKIDLTFPDDVGQLTATGTFADGSQSDITRLARWDSLAPMYVGVSQGVVTPVGLGTKSVVASFDGVKGSAEVTVVPGQPVSLMLDGILSIPKQCVAPTTVIGLYPKGVTLDMTSAVTWQSDDPSIASFDGPLNGAITGHKPGSTTYYATFGALKSQMQSVTVTDMALVAIRLSSGMTAYLSVGDTLDMMAIGTFDDGSEFDLTLQATWKTANANVAAVSDMPDSRGHLTAVGKGATSLTATVGTSSSTIAIIVNSP